MATVLRKNEAWLHGLLKDRLPVIVPDLLYQEVISTEDKEAALKEDVDPSTRARDLLDVIEEQMSNHVDPCSFGLKFIEVLISSGIGWLDYLQKTAEEFKKEQNRASRRSSVDSNVGCLDSSSSSVFIEYSRSVERQDDKRRGSTGNIEKIGQRKHSSERRRSAGSESSQHKRASRSYSDPGEWSLQQKNLTPHSQSASSHSHSASSDASDNDKAELEKGDRDNPMLYHTPLNSVLHSIAENPNSPDVFKKFTAQGGTPAGLSPSPLLDEPEDSEDSEGPNDSEDSVTDLTCNSDAEWTDEQFGVRESSILQQFVRIVSAVKETGERGDQKAMEEEYYKMLTYYQQKVTLLSSQKQQSDFAHQEEVEDLLSAVELHKRRSEEGEQRLKEKDQQLDQVQQQLDERGTQLAIKEKEVYDLQTDKKDLEEECKRLERRLAEKQKQVRLLAQGIKQRQLEIELFKSDQLLESNLAKQERNNKTVIKQKMKQWKEMKHLLDQLFEGKDITHVKLAIVQKVNSIKTTGMRRPSTS